MAAPGQTDQLIHIRAWRGISGTCASFVETSGMIFGAAQALGSDLVSPRSSHEELMSEHARTFRFATRFLPSIYRDATIRLYAFFRSLDDLVDESPDDPATIARISEELDQWEFWFDEGCSGPSPRPDIGASLEPVITQYQIPIQLFRDFLEGLRADLQPVTPSSRGDVEHYSYQVASTVGIAMAHVFGSTSPAAIDAARRLGIAMQLTNILRDVGGDSARSRVYLPADLLLKCGLEPSQVIDQWKAGAGPDPQLKTVIKTMTVWADDHYAAGIAGIRTLPRDVQMPILVAARLYQRILRQLEANDYDSLRQRASTNGRQKLSEAARCVVLIQHCLREAEDKATRDVPRQALRPKPVRTGSHAR
jgi:15-cis-phytoene synthase